MPNLTADEKEMAIALSKAATSSGLGLLGGPLRRVLAKAAIAAAASPEPTWADVREAARNAGYRLRRRGPHHNDHVHLPMRKMTRWDLEPVADGVEARGGFTLHYSWWFNDGDDGSSLAIEIDLDDASGTELLVWDATPVQAMHALGLVGLGGGDER